MHDLRQSVTGRIRAMREIVARPAGAGAFEVEATAGGRRHAWRVSVPGELAARHGSEPEEVARATIAFLLDRESPGSIMASFDCSVVPRYFPEYDVELPGYLAGAAGAADGD
jgi:hypothetical protein